VTEKREPLVVKGRVVRCAECGGVIFLDTPLAAGLVVHVHARCAPKPEPTPEPEHGLEVKWEGLDAGPPVAMPDASPVPKPKARKARKPKRGKA